jgi:HD-GYP domain-containing protein (c-di-GMP phosphodiesterase class II)
VLGWVWLVDGLLSPLGVLAAIASVHQPYAFVLVLTLPGLLAVFAGERNARISHGLELSSAYRGTALLLGDLLERADAYTGGDHTHGVVELSLLVSDELGLPSRSRRRVELAALLHDVGKIAIPPSIITKAGPLTPEEWAVMRTHTIEGQRMLDRVGGALGAVGQIVRASHERYDGSGYPDGLVGREIPREAAIIAVCDAYDAMTTDRPYRGARSPGAALAEIRSETGAQFDPRVVGALERVLAPLLAPEPARQPALVPALTQVGAAG